MIKKGVAFLIILAERYHALAALAHLRSEKCFFSRTRKALKRCLWQIKRGAFEAAPRLAGADSAREPDGATVTVEKTN